MSMRHSTLLLVPCVAIASLGMVSQALAQATAQRPAGDVGHWVVPRTPEGHPDLQGNWTNVTVTPFQRAEDL